MRRKLKSEIIGHITVDSGLVFLGDPGYVSGSSNPLNDWENFCKQYANDKTPSGNATVDNGRFFGAGLVFRTLNGDGIYEVKAKKDENGNIVSISISFE